MQQGVQFADERLELLEIVFRGNHANERIDHICAVAEEEDGEYGYHDQAGEGGKSRPLPSSSYTLDGRLVLNEKRFGAFLLRLAPAIFAADLRCDFTGRNAGSECGYLLRELRRLPKRAGSHEMDGEGDEDQKAEIGLRHVRAPEISENKGVALQKPDDGIDQICEENRESEDHEYAAGDI